MLKKRLVPLVAAAIAVIALAGFGSVAAPVGAQQATPTPVTTGNIPLVAISPAICFPLVISRFASQVEGISHAGNCAALGNPLTAHAALLDLEAVIGNDNGKIEPADFAAIDLDGNQVHQADDAGGGTSDYNGNLIILAFVDRQGPVRFVTNRGLMIPAGLVSPTQDLTAQPADQADQVYVCDSQAGTASGAAVEDTDCDGGSQATDDGVVVGRLRSLWGASMADIGPGTVTVNQGQQDVGTIGFRVVGEPWTLSFVTLEKSIQDGVKDLDGDGKFGSTGECPLPFNASAVLGANATAERSVILAVVKDKEGNGITGAVVNWSTSDPNMAIMAAPLTPTLDLGSFGFGAPDLICGRTTTGTVSALANVSKNLTTQVPTFDPGATVMNGSVDYTVVGVPASMTLAVDPPSVVCDGTATASVSATIVDSAGTPAVAGTNVHFDSQLLGTANPIDAVTDATGVAKSVITPLSSDTQGVTVVVTTGTLAQSVLVACTAGTGTTPPPSGGGTTGSGTGGATSGGGTGITGPNTGTGDARSAAGGMSWMFLLAMSGIGLLAGSALVWTGARAKRR